MEPTYTVDGDGDTLLILCDPDRPFEQVDHDDLWYNHLEQYNDITNDQSRLRDNVKDYHYRLQETRHNHESSERKYLGRQVSWRVSSDKLKSASAHFRDLAAQDWNEGDMSEQGYRYTITVEGWNEGALDRLLLVVHGQDACLHDLQDNLELCAQLAVIVHAYQFHSVFRVTFPAVPGRYPYNENLLFSLFSSWVFRDEDSFKVFSKAIIMQARGRIHTLGMPIPEHVINAIEQRRQHYVAEMVNFAEDKLKKLFMCDEYACIVRDETMELTFGSWPPEGSLEGFSPMNVYRALDHIGGWDDLNVNDCNYQDLFSETDTLSEVDACSEGDMSSDTDTDVSGSSFDSVTLLDLMEGWEGLDLADCTDV
ncbi:hypothetical protein ACQKWADRAFT_319179 [Trichoderma austrokoningii]